MRVFFPKDIEDEREEMVPYLEYRQGEGIVLKRDVPKEIAEKYRSLKQRIEQFKLSCI